MGTPHKHRDVIIAWANGEEVEFFSRISEKWEKIDEPNWLEHHQYRIKPKMVKKEGWIVPICSGQYAVFPTEEMAARSIKHREDLKPIRIEWEEEA